MKRILGWWCVAAGLTAMLSWIAVNGTWMEGLVVGPGLVGLGWWVLAGTRPAA